jgi:hypothetical protein
MATIEAERNSRLSRVELITLNNGTEEIEFWELPDNTVVEVSAAGSDSIKTFNANERVDTVSHNALGDVVAWDVIAGLNELRELPQDLKPGDRIRVPTRPRLASEIRA